MIRLRCRRRRSRRSEVEAELTRRGGRVEGRLRGRAGEGGCRREVQDQVHVRHAFDRRSFLQWTAFNQLRVLRGGGGGKMEE